MSVISGYIEFELNSGATAFVRPSEIACIVSHCNDNTLTRLLIKGLVNEQLIIKATPWEVQKIVNDFEADEEK